jgi:hypothetical protein
VTESEALLAYEAAVSAYRAARGTDQERTARQEAHVCAEVLHTARKAARLLGEAAGTRNFISIS